MASFHGCACETADIKDTITKSVACIKNLFKYANAHVKDAYAAFNTYTIYSENAFFHNERSFECACWRNSSEQESCIRVARALPIGMPLGCFLLYLVISVCVWFTRHECSTNIRHHVAKWKTPRHQMVSVVNTVFFSLLRRHFFRCHLSTLLLLLYMPASIHFTGTLCMHFVHGAVSALCRPLHFEPKHCDGNSQGLRFFRPRVLCAWLL